MDIDPRKGAFNAETGESLGLPYLGPEYQEAYRTALQEEKRTVCQSRVMIVGHSGAGKSSLLRCLLNQPFVEEHIPTIGFEVNKTTDWTLQEETDIRYEMEMAKYIMRKVKELPASTPVEKKAKLHENVKIPSNIAKLILEMEKIEVSNKKAVDLSLWDTSGQGLFYDTHQMFLSSRGIYIIVLDLTKGLEQKLTPLDYLDYWMSCIYSTVRQQDRVRDKKTPRQPAIVIVCTHKDVYKGSIDHYMKTVKEFLERKEYNKHRYHEIFAVSTRSPDSPEVQHLRDVLGKLALDEEYEVPLIWFNLKECMKSTKKNVLTWEEFEQIAQEADVHGDVQMRSALAFFHAVGDLVFFDEMPDCIVTDPQWLIDQFTKVISTENKDDPEQSEYWAELDEYGYLRGSLLEKIWPHERERKQMTKLMEKFALLLPVRRYLPRNIKVKRPEKGEKEFLVPCLLPPAVQQKPDTQKPLTLKPVCGFIPAGLTGRLFSSLCINDEWYICGQVDTRTASFLLEDGCHASLTTNASPPEIEIRGTCPKNKTLRGTLDVISWRLAELPGTVEFDLYLQCSHATEKVRLGKLGEIDKILEENPLICDHPDGKRLLESEYRSWFFDPITSIEAHIELPLEDDLDRCFKGNLRVFRRRLDVDAAFLMELYSSKVITQTSKETLESKPTHIERIVTLMTDVLPKRSYLHKQLFLKCLLDTEQEHILEEIGMTSEQIELIKKLSDEPVSKEVVSPDAKVERESHPACDSLVSFTGLFTHTKGGVLESQDSDVVLQVPQGAVPEGKEYTITVTVHTDLKEYNQAMKSRYEYIAGPVPEFVVEGGEAVFERPVQIIIPHCIRTPSRSSVRVLAGIGRNFQEINTKSYYIEESTIHIMTRHFTKFLVSNTETALEITDAMLTVAAKRNKSNINTFIDLRLMLHSHCAMLNDFSAARMQCYSPGMKEIERFKVRLPERTEAMNFPLISIDLDCHHANNWKIVKEVKRYNIMQRIVTLMPFHNEKRMSLTVNGRDVLKLSGNGTNHRSEKLANFIFENPSCTAEPLVCYINCAFNYDDGTVESERMQIVYPSLGADMTNNPLPPSMTIQEVIDRKRPELLVSIVIDTTLTSLLVSKGVILATQMEDIKAIPGSDGVDCLLSYIRAGNRDMYYKFREALMETNRERAAKLLPAEVLRG